MKYLLFCANFIRLILGTPHCQLPYALPRKLALHVKYLHREPKSMANTSGKRYAQSSSTLNSYSLTSLATISSQRARCSSYLSGLAMKPHLEVTSSQRSAQKHAVALGFRNVKSNCEDSQIRFTGSSL